MIAIVAVLVSLLLPALASARRAARQTICLSNVRQLELAHTQYMGDFREHFVDAGLAHGGLGDPRTSWPVQLARYASGPTGLALRSPDDRSPFWPTSEGGASAAMSFRDYLALWTSNPGVVPPRVAVARWTSYGLNNYLTASKAPAVELSKRRYTTLSSVASPTSTVHFLMMTRGEQAAPSSFAVADHVHAESWDDGAPGTAAALADREMQTGAWGGRDGTGSAVANYGFLDGHAAIKRFDEVYTSFDRNLFWPDAQR